MAAPKRQPKAACLTIKSNREEPRPPGPIQSFIKEFRDEFKGDCKPDLTGKIVHEETLVAAAGLME